MWVRFPPLVPTTYYTMKQIPTNTYKMSKPLKTMLANITDPHERTVFKTSMIDAELTAQIKPKTKVEKTETEKSA